MRIGAGKSTENDKEAARRVICGRDGAEAEDALICCRIRDGGGLSSNFYWYKSGIKACTCQLLLPPITGELRQLETTIIPASEQLEPEKIS